MWFIGDIHGKIDAYKNLIKDKNMESSIQVGDVGLGFKGVDLSIKRVHKFIRGNHDSPKICRNHPNYLGEYGYLPEQELFFISGAWSIDWRMRLEGVSWWTDEQLSYVQLQSMIDFFANKKPRYVVSHDCPNHISYQVLHAMKLKVVVPEGTRTSVALEQAFEKHQPEKWFFGHYHTTMKIESCGTVFQCIGELDAVEEPSISPLNGK